MNGNKTSWLLLISAAILIFAAPSMSAAQTSSATVGIFEDHGDVGEVLHPGTAEYDPATASYKISGSGANIWFATDAFHFVWKKVSGDVSLTADAAFVTQPETRTRRQSSCFVSPSMRTPHTLTLPCT